MSKDRLNNALLTLRQGGAIRSQPGTRNMLAANLYTFPAALYSPTDEPMGLTLNEMTALWNAEKLICIGYGESGWVWTIAPGATDF